MTTIENIALFDMDGTLCDYDKGLMQELKKIHSPFEPNIDVLHQDPEPEYIKARRNLITSSEHWWENLSKLKLGFDIWNLASKLGYRKMILTQGPQTKPAAWSGKIKWIHKNLGLNTEMTLTRDKGLVYGKVLVDDFPEYIQRWLEYRPRGLVIMPANNSNKSYTHNQVIRYDGTNIKEVASSMQNAKLRDNP